MTVRLAASKLAGDPEQIWMIGDNVEADIRGAENMEWKAVLIRRKELNVRHNCLTLPEVVEVLEGN